MPLRTSGFCLVLVLLAGCATRPAPVEPKPQATVTAPAGLRGTILAIRPVPANAVEPARLLLSGAGTIAGQPDPALVELVVRTASGTTIAVVQPATDGLHPGEAISIQPGAQPRIDPPPVR